MGGNRDRSMDPRTSPKRVRLAIPDLERSIGFYRLRPIGEFVDRALSPHREEGSE